MNSAAEHTTSTDLAGLIQQCAALCEQAQKRARDFPADRARFLAENLQSSLRQVELILQVIEQGESRDQSRQSFLRRLFGKGDVTHESDDVAPQRPTFDVTTQGLLGNSWTVSIAELLGFLAFSHKSGVLWVDSPTENFLVGIIDGRLKHASSDHTPEGLRLGEVLVGLGCLTRRQLERFIAHQQVDGDNPDGVSGELLLDWGMITDEELHEALSHQVVNLFQRLVSNKEAVFRFQEGVNVQLAFHVDLDINQLLLDSARLDDEVENPAAMAATVLGEWEAWRSEIDESASAPAMAAQPQAASGQDLPEALEPADPDEVDPSTTS